MATKKITIHEAGQFRFVDCGYCENGVPDFRMQEFNDISKKWYDVYEFDNQMQMLLAIEDPSYPLWLTGKTIGASSDTLTNLHR